MKLFLHYLKYLFFIFGIAMLTTTILRGIEFVSCFSLLSEEGVTDKSLWFGAFLRGLWFDTVISCYVLILPLVLTFIASLFGCKSRWFSRTIAWLLFLLFGIVISVSTANIPYFGYFFRNINSSIFQWSEEVTTNMGMMFSEVSFVLYIILGFALLFLFAFVIYKSEKRFFETISTKKTDSYVKTVLLALILIPLCVFGIRGRLGYNPIKVSAAFFCNDPFLNQLGISPTFNLLTSILDANRKENKRLSLMDDAEALKELKDYFGINNQDNSIVRTISADSVVLKNPNIVLVLMESMSARFMAEFGNTDNVTPFLDSLANNSLFFNNFYSAGNHTNHGITSTLYSVPAIMDRNAMKGSVIPRIEGLPTVLKSMGYTTYFYMTHESQYDNMNAFLRTNGFDNIRSQEDYPREKVVNHFGVSDDYLFEYASNELLSLSDSVPFFATILTISNHPPYVFPDGFESRNEERELAIVEYADECLRKFFETYKSSPKFDNTLFVFLADHGKIVGTPECEIPLSSNQVPMMIYYKDCEARKVDGLGCQCDVMPTILGFLGKDYDYQGFGKNLLKEKRDEIVFSADNMLVALDSTNLYLYSPITNDEHIYKMNGTQFAGKSNMDSAGNLKRFLFYTMQGAEFLKKN